MNGWATGHNSLLLQTSNGGEDWELQQSPVECRYREVFFKDMDHGWAVSRWGVMVHTSNGGDTWELYQIDSSYGSYQDDGSSSTLSKRGYF